PLPTLLTHTSPRIPYTPLFRSVGRALRPQLDAVQAALRRLIRRRIRDRERIGVVAVLRRGRRRGRLLRIDPHRRRPIGLHIAGEIGRALVVSMVTFTHLMRSAD